MTFDRTPKVDTARKAAQANYTSDDLDIENEAKVRVAETGYWVEAFVWVSNEDVDDYNAHEGTTDPATRSDVTIYGAGGA
jgi:hypothetical protein